MGLEAKHCVPCQGGVEPMGREQAEAMLEQVPGWALDESATRLYRKFRTRDFMAAVELVGRVAEIAEAEDHHPDLVLGYGYAEVWIHTHKIGGLHENDFILAARINQREDGG